MSRPGRQRMEMDELYVMEKVTCPRCGMKFEHIFEMDRHLERFHKLTTDVRENIYLNMGIRWFSNYAPPGRWKGWFIE